MKTVTIYFVDVTIKYINEPHTSGRVATGFLEVVTESGTSAKIVATRVSNYLRGVYTDPHDFCVVTKFIELYYAGGFNVLEEKGHIVGVQAVFTGTNSASEDVVSKYSAAIDGITRKQIDDSFKDII